jgi:hypothetical protein
MGACAQSSHLKPTFAVPELSRKFVAIQPGGRAIDKTTSVSMTALLGSCGIFPHDMIRRHKAERHQEKTLLMLS